MNQPTFLGNPEDPRLQRCQRAIGLPQLPPAKPLSYLKLMAKEAEGPPSLHAVSDRITHLGGVIEASAFTQMVENARWVT